ncbi:hypothetical protein DUNSADRAFT_538 [Dunaliella salina]|uniref:Pyruvate, phosphate dikinase n=1 Tax=Dunaliella salina TaxID=3046 RepID=A0ABQ7FYV6_DUNSA|nr:hypothetical protein DUNSADRAFT_538 [Dunaliella salina]|eukprot:KAF5827513.1 hypothetical protein DUNSADRAFT_538 [Dunaliella salina]
MLLRYSTLQGACNTKSPHVFLPPPPHPVFHPQRFAQAAASHNAPNSLSAPAAPFELLEGRQKCAAARRKTALQAVSVEAKPTEAQKVFVFGKTSQGDASMKALLGGKGANLAEMSKIGLSVPPGFTITTDTCAQFHENDRQLPPGCWEEVLAGLRTVEAEMGCGLGDAANPLLLSVRSGAAISMPGMMDTVLNLGMSDSVVKGLSAKAGERFAYDAYRRFLDMFGDVVMGVSHSKFEHQLEKLKRERGVTQDTDLTAQDLQTLVERYKQVYLEAGKVFPEDPFEQLRYAIYAVFDSWQSERANVYRSINQITGLKGTGVTVQAMAFGNMGPTSGTGVCFTRNPSNGEKRLYGEYLINAQGEDVVAGIRTPEPIERLSETLPEAYAQLIENCRILEAHYKDMQDIEFTVQEGKLFMLQCRSGKRTGPAAFKIAVDLVDEGVISEEQAMLMQIREGDFISLNGTSGEIILGKQALTSPDLGGDLARFMGWVDKARSLRVFTNCDTPADAKEARKFGAEGIGLCRTEHMFFASEERIANVRRMIVAQTPQERVAALTDLLPYQRSDFEGLLRAMEGLPVTIRLLDPPLHEFLPDGDLEEVCETLARATGKRKEDLYEIVDGMQVLSAAGVPDLAYKVGTMIEVPRAALQAGDIASVASFFSFGTNDLTQMTFGYSRDDISKFLPVYLERGILQYDPFQVLDQDGVGELIKIAVERGRAARPDIKIGICGEQGGEPMSVAFVHGLGLDYVSCSPFRVPIARLAAAQAVLSSKKSAK